MHLVLLDCGAKCLQAFSIFLSPFRPGVSASRRLDVPLEFFNAEVTVVVQFGKRLPHPQGCEAGLWALVPTLFHDLHNGCKDL